MDFFNHSLTPPLQMALGDAHKHWIPVGPRGGGVQQTSKQVQEKHVKSMTQQAKMLAAPRNHTFL